MIYDKPLASAYTGDSELYETCVWLGCVAAKGKSNETDVFNAIWNKFQTINIITRDGRILYYYKDGIYTGLYYHTDDLLCFGDGRCQAWAEFFNNILACQGISSFLFGFEINFDYIISYLKAKYSLSNNDILNLNIYLQQIGDNFKGNGYPNDRKFPDHVINVYNNTFYDVTCGIGSYEYSENGLLEYLRQNATINCDYNNQLLEMISGNNINLDLFYYSFNN